MDPDGSHFAMMKRWWAGDIHGGAALHGGFFGRRVRLEQAGRGAAAAEGQLPAPAAGLRVSRWGFRGSSEPLFHGAARGAHAIGAR